MKFKKGDRVKYVKSTLTPAPGLKIGMTGTVVTSAPSRFVEFDEYINGHSALGHGKSGHCWNMLEEELQLLDGSEIEEVLYGTKTTIIKWADGTQTEAVCSPEDNFDKKVGFAIAYTRKINGGKLHE